MRNIQSCAVSDLVRNLMRSLFFLRHPNWDDTISAIQTTGGKAGKGVCYLLTALTDSFSPIHNLDWVQDKIRGKFAFPALCWEQSFIPEDVWKAGEAHSNLIESIHTDVNREGVRCTLVGGLKKGQAFNKPSTSLRQDEDEDVRGE
jgi:hypothetical protein